MFHRHCILNRDDDDDADADGHAVVKWEISETTAITTKLI